MKRIKLSGGIEAQVLMEVRRRCSVCYGLNHDFRVKQGQIAHLDHNPNNNSIDNLVFLCFDHHDNYDSKTSQSKNLTILEIKGYKKELIKQVEKKWLGKNEQKIYPDYFSGEYLGVDNKDASLNVLLIATNKIQVTGTALWGKNQKNIPNIGSIDFIGTINDNKVRFEEELQGQFIRIDFTFYGHKLKIVESYLPEKFGYFGKNVSFGGEYYKK